MKRRSRQAKRLRGRRTGQSPYRRYAKREFLYGLGLIRSSTKPRSAAPA